MPRKNCVVCGSKLPKGHPSFCSNKCAGNYYFPSGWDNCHLVVWSNSRSDSKESGK